MNPYIKVKEIAESVDKELKANDFTTSVLVNHRSGILLQEDAIARTYEFEDGPITHKFLIVYAEHDKPRIFGFDEILYFSQFSPIYPS